MNFSGQEKFVRTRHLDKYLIYITWKKGPAGKITIVFLLNTHKTDFQIRNVTHR